jgi:hypothetical protein
MKRYVPLISVALLLIGAAPAAQAQGPVFSATGPDAAEYGAAAGFLPGTVLTAAEPQHLVATYSHFDELVPARRVARAAAPWPFKRVAEPAIVYQFGGQRLPIANYLGRHPATGLLIAKDDTILYEHYQYARTDRDRLLSQSMAKTITAMLVGIALEEKKIKSIDDLASHYVPALANAEYGGTTLRTLLQMSSGVAFSENYDGADDIAQLSRDLTQGKDPAASVARFNTRVAPAGARFQYASSETEVLGLVLRAPPACRSRTICARRSGSRSAPRPTRHGRSTAPGRSSHSAASMRCCATMRGSAGCSRMTAPGRGGS